MKKLFIIVFLCTIATQEIICKLPEKGVLKEAIKEGAFFGGITSSLIMLYPFGIGSLMTIPMIIASRGKILKEFPPIKIIPGYTALSIIASTLAGGCAGANVALKNNDDSKEEIIRKSGDVGISWGTLIGKSMYVLGGIHVSISVVRDLKSSYSIVQSYSKKNHKIDI